MGLADVTGAFGGAGPKYRGYRPKKGNVRAYEQHQRGDIEQLYSDEPFEGPGLGFSPDVLQMAAGLSEGDRIAEEQEQYEDYAQSPYGVRGADFLARKEGLRRDQTRRRELVKADIAVRNEGQKREDLYRRLGATGSAYQQGADLFNQFAERDYAADMARFQQKKNRYRAVGELADTGIDYALKAASIGGSLGAGI